MTARLRGAMRWVAAAAATRALVLAVVVLAVLGVGPRTGHYRTLTVLSASMAPAIPEGSMVVVTPEPAASMRAGWVVTYLPPAGGEVLTHRVTEVTEGGDRPAFRTKGDAASVADPWEARVEGDTVWRVRFVVPAAGDVIRWFRRPAVHGLVRVVGPALLAVGWLSAIWRRPQPAPA